MVFWLEMRYGRFTIFSYIGIGTTNAFISNYSMKSLHALGIACKWHLTTRQVSLRMPRRSLTVFFVVLAFKQRRLTISFCFGQMIYSEIFDSCILPANGLHLLFLLFIYPSVECVPFFVWSAPFPSFSRWLTTFPAL